MSCSHWSSVKSKLASTVKYGNAIRTLNIKNYSLKFSQSMRIKNSKPNKLIKKYSLNDFFN